MNDISNTTRIAEDVSTRLSELTKSLKGWNLITGLYSEATTHEEDVVHAMATEAREIVLLSIRFTYKLGDAGLQGRETRFNNLLHRLAELDEREKKLATLCRAAMAEVKSKKGKEVA